MIDPVEVAGPFKILKRSRTCQKDPSKFLQFSTPEKWCPSSANSGQYLQWLSPLASLRHHFPFPVLLVHSSARLSRLYNPHRVSLALPNPITESLYCIKHSILAHGNFRVRNELQACQVCKPGLVGLKRSAVRCGARAARAEALAPHSAHSVAASA